MNRLIEYKDTFNNIISFLQLSDLLFLSLVDKVTSKHLKPIIKKMIDDKCWKTKDDHMRYINWGPDLSYSVYWIKYHNVPEPGVARAIIFTKSCERNAIEFAKIIAHENDYINPSGEFSEICSKGYLELSQWLHQEFKFNYWNLRNSFTNARNNNKLAIAQWLYSVDNSIIVKTDPDYNDIMSWLNTNNLIKN